jgi:hypothetical protein
MAKSFPAQLDVSIGNIDVSKREWMVMMTEDYAKNNKSVLSSNIQKACRLASEFFENGP